jgi:hypothetical protein
MSAGTAGHGDAMSLCLVTRRLVTLLLVSAAVSVGSAHAQGPPAADLDILRRDTLARFEVITLRQGIALVGRGRDRRVEVVDGLVLDGGAPLSGAELRARLGPDAAIALRLSYLDNAALRALFTPPSAAVPPALPSPPIAPPAPPVLPSLPATVGSTPPPAPVPPSPSRVYRRTGARIAVGKSITVAENEEVADAVVAIGGRIQIAGRVRDAVVAIGGSVELLPTADVHGDITAIGGTVTVAPGARHTGAVHHADGDWPRGWGGPLFAGSWLDFGGAARWLTLAGTLTRVGLLAVAVALVMIVASGRIGRIGAAAAAAPLRAGAIGFGLQVVFVPAVIVLSLILAITIVGLPFVAVVIPLALVTMFLAMLLGFASLAHVVGGWAASRLGWDAPAAVWLAVLGLAVIVLPTVLSRLVGVAPDALRAGAFALLAIGTIVEYVAWTIGLGAAAMTGLGRWATTPPPLPGPGDAAPSAL